MKNNKHIPTKEEWDLWKGLEYYPYPRFMCHCNCKGKIPVKLFHKQYGIPNFLYGHGQLGSKKSNRIKVFITRTCECGDCGEQFRAQIFPEYIPTKRFVPGHQHRNSIGWSKGLTKETHPSLKKISEALMGRTKENDPSVAAKSEKLKGRKISPEAGRKISKANKGRKHTEEAKRKNSENHNSEECSNRMVNKWKEPDYRENQIQLILKGACNKSVERPNKQEKQLIWFLNNLFPKEYKYVGDGEVIIAGKNPDFINVNGQKKIIELFGDYWHGEKLTGVPNEEHEQERKDIFSQYGYSTLIIWGKELGNTKILTNKIVEFQLS